MALMSHIVNNLLQDVTNPLAYLYDQHFGLGLCDDILFGALILLSSIPRRSLSSLRQKLIAFIVNANNNIDNIIIIMVSVDVQQFKPEEIEVKVVDDYLVIEAKHEKRQDKHGFISRQFTRRYKLPETINLEAIKSSISSDGILLVSAPKKIKKMESNVRQIPIMQTNQPALKEVKDLPVLETKSEEKEN